MNALKPTTPRAASSSRRSRSPGTSPPHSAKSTAAWPVAAATLASKAAPSTVGGWALSGISTQAVAPPAASAAVPVAQPSQSARPGSLKCTWASIAPGSTCSPRASTSSRAGSPISGAILGDDAVVDGDVPLIAADDQVDHARSPTKRSSTSSATATSASATASAGLWLMPRSQRTNSIAIGATAAIATPSWPAPLGSASGRRPAASTACGEALGQLGRGRHRRGLAALVPLQRDLAARGDPLGLRAQVGDRLAAHGVARVPHVEREPRLAGDDVARARVDGDPPDGRDQTRAPARERFGGEHPLRRGGERVAAVGHRHGAGVAGLAAEGQLGLGLAGDRGDDADRRAAALEHRPLLDVQLAVAEQVRRGPRSRWSRDRRRTRAAPRPA